MDINDTTITTASILGNDIFNCILSSDVVAYLDYTCTAPLTYTPHSHLIIGSFADVCQRVGKITLCQIFEIPSIFFSFCTEKIFKPCEC